MICRSKIRRKKWYPSIDCGKLGTCRYILVCTSNTGTYLYVPEQYPSSQAVQVQRWLDCQLFGGRLRLSWPSTALWAGLALPCQGPGQPERQPSWHSMLTLPGEACLNSQSDLSWFSHFRTLCACSQYLHSALKLWCYLDWGLVCNSCFQYLWDGSWMAPVCEDMNYTCPQWC